MSYHVNREKNVATMLKTILPSLPWAVTTLNNNNNNVNNM